MATRAGWLIGIAMVTVACGSVPARAQTCLGDCDGNGTATIDEIVRGVNILLERAALDLCPSVDGNGSGTVTVDELVRAVADLLGGCATTPTPTPPLSPTATSTQTSVIPNVAGQWREDQYRIASSTCIQDINDEIQAELMARGPCIFTVSQEGALAMFTSCDLAIESVGTVDAQGVVTVDFGESPPNGCYVFDSAFRGNLGMSSTTSETIVEVTFEGDCAMPACTLRIESRWTRL